MITNSNNTGKGYISRETDPVSFKYFIPLGLSFLLLVVLNIIAGQNWIDSDMSAEMVFSDLLSDTGHLFASPDWYYSTEFRILYTQILFVPLLKIIGSWSIVRIITNIVFYIILVLSYMFMMKGYEAKYVLLTSSVLLLPVSEAIAQHVQFGNTYMSHMILMFLAIGFVRRLDSPRINLTGKVLLWIPFSALCFICGASGVRYFLIIFAPLLLSGIWRTYDMYGIQDGALKKWLAGLSLFKISFGASLIALAGYAVNTLIIRSNYVFTTYESLSFVPINNGIWFERVASVTGCLLEVFGYIPGGSVLSLRGIVTLCAFVMIFLMFYMVRRTYKDASAGSGLLGGDDIFSESDPEDLFFLHMFISGFAVMSFFLLFTDTTLTPRYFSTCIYMSLPVLVIWLSRENERALRMVYVTALAFCLVLSTLKISYSMIKTDKNEARKEVVDYLEYNGLYKGYSFYDDSNILVELSDGKLEVGAVNKDDFSFFLWSTPGRFYTEGGAPGYFLLVPEGTAVPDTLNLRSFDNVAGYDVYVFE